MLNKSEAKNDVYIFFRTPEEGGRIRTRKCPAFVGDSPLKNVSHWTAIKRVSEKAREKNFAPKKAAFSCL